MEPGQGNFPRKIRQRADLSIGPDRLNQIISGIKNQIEPVGTILDYSKLFMPDMSKRTLITITESSPYVYKINVPGFIYRQHIAGDWDAECGIKVLVSNESTFKNAYLYLDTKGAPVNANDHGNNLFPVRPGDNTFMIFYKYNQDDNMNVYFVPALGTTLRAGESVTRLSFVKDPTVVNPGALTDSKYLKCFESVLDISHPRYRSGSSVLKFPEGTLACSERSETAESNMIMQKLDELLVTHPIKSGDISSTLPDMTNMVEMKDSIYRVNTSGFFYRHIKSAKTTAGSSSGIVLSSTVSNMESLRVGIYTSTGESHKFENDLVVYGNGSESPVMIESDNYIAPKNVAVLAQAKKADSASNTGRVNYTVMTGNDRFGGSCLNMIPISPGSDTEGTAFGPAAVYSVTDKCGIVTRVRGGVISRVSERHSSTTSCVSRANELTAIDPIKYGDYTFHRVNKKHYLEYNVYTVYYNYKVSQDTCVVEGDGTFVYFCHDSVCPKDQYYFIPSRRVFNTEVNPLTEVREVSDQITYGIKSKKINSVSINSAVTDKDSTLIKLQISVNSNNEENRVIEYFDRCFKNSKIIQESPFAVFIHTLKKPEEYPSLGYPKYLYESLDGIKIFNPKA